MTKFKKSITTYKVHSEKTDIDYLVSLERIANTNSDNPRFMAQVTPLVAFGTEPNGIEYQAYVYMFHGSYHDERTEAQLLIDRIVRSN